MVIAWQWLTMASAAAAALDQRKPKKREKDFFEGKIVVARYFYTYELPKISGLAEILNKSTQMTSSMSEAYFTD
ncbi:MAG: acyl-CoA dehydrogenase C-terminal domain-containing protein [Desulfobacteraceae bacterium]